MGLSDATMNIHNATFFLSNGFNNFANEKIKFYHSLKIA